MSLPEEEPLEARVLVLEGLLKVWLTFRKMNPTRRRELRMHTRKVLGIQSPLTPETRRETPAEKAHRLGLSDGSPQKGTQIIKPGDDSA